MKKQELHNALEMCGAVEAARVAIRNAKTQTKSKHTPSLDLITLIRDQLNQGTPESVFASAPDLLRQRDELREALQNIIDLADDPDNAKDRELVDQIDWAGIRAALANATEIGVSL